MYQLGRLQKTPGWRVAHFGRNANNGTQTGTFYWNWNNSSSNANRNIGTRNYRPAEHCCCSFLTPRSNTLPLEPSRCAEQLGGADQILKAA